MVTFKRLPASAMCPPDLCLHKDALKEQDGSWSTFGYSFEIIISPDDARV